MKKGIIIFLLLFMVSASYSQNGISRNSFTEQNVRKYLDTAKYDPIEGIYKYVSSNRNWEEYRLGIIKSNYSYLIIVLETNRKNWNRGDVKAYLEPSAIEGYFSLKWIRDDHVTEKETVAYSTKPGIIEFNLFSKTYLLKLYPKLKPKQTETNNKNAPFASGSGFFISNDGYIATNAHVVKNGSRYEVTVNNELNVSINYNAKVILVDETNDVAILKIEDENFINKNLIPYSLVSSTEIGQEIFTIGYPLSNIMGKNYKVSNGIINSNTGVKDDKRYIQISSPIQAGNSGGPLFNKNGNIIGITTSKLNEDAIGQKVENVNYAIKIKYLISLINMLPSIKIEIKSTVETIDTKQVSLEQHVSSLKNYVCLIRVYN